MIALVEGSVALIQGKKFSGSGFVVALGVVATNAHVIASEHIDDLRVTFPSAPPGSDGPFVCDLLYEDKALDLALLRTPCKQPPLVVDASYHIRRGQSVLVIGNPGSLAVDENRVLNAVCSGVMSSTVKINGHEHYQISAIINPGNSGGPVVDLAGRVLGVATLKDAQREGLGFCVPASEVAAALNGLGVLQPDHTRRLNAVHEMGIPGIKMIIAMSLYGKRLDDHDSQVRQAVNSGRSPYTAVPWNPAKDVADLAVLDAVLNTEIYPELYRASVDPILDPSLRSKANELWADLLAVRNAVYHPGGSMIEFSQAYRVCSERGPVSAQRFTEALQAAGRSVIPGR